jgi:hypothetical protein
MDTLSLRRLALPAGLFVLTLATRLVALWRFSLTPYSQPVTGDMAFYAQWGKRIASGEFTDFHAFYGQPLYAYLLGGLFSISGFQPVLMGAVQAVLDALTAVLIFEIALCVFRETPNRAAAIGAVAAGAWALFVPATTYSLLLVAASWTTFAWWLAVWWIFRRSVDARPLEWLFVAAAVGAFAMMSATILFALPPILYRAATRRSVAAAAAIFCGILAGTAPAWLHNAIVARDPVFLSAHSGLNFWIGNNPDANGYPRVPRELPSEQAALLAQSITVAEAAAGRPLKRSEVSEFWSAKASDYIASNPSDWTRLLGVKGKNFWNRFIYDDLSSITALRDAGVIWPGLSFGLIAAFALPGCVLAAAIPRARWVIAVVFLQMIALLPVFVNERYRLSAAPGLLLLAVFFLHAVWSAIAFADGRRLAVSLALLAASAWFVSLSPGEPALWSLDDYKTAKRQLVARDYANAERRFRRALESMLPASQVSAAVASGFVESAQEKLQAGDRATALEILREASRINPADDRIRELHRRLSQTPDPG